MLIDAALLQTCAPQMDKAISYAIVKTESNFNLFAIGVNRSAGLRSQPKSYQQAVVTAKQLLAQGKNIDLGLAQINSNNLRWLGLSVEQAFNPCANLKAMQTVYLNCLSRFGNSGGKGTPQQRAFSCYNTGNGTRGFGNGYVTKVTNHYNTLMAQLRGGQMPQQRIPARQIPQAPTLVAATRTPAAAEEVNELFNAESPSVAEQVAATNGDFLVSETHPIPQKPRYQWDVFGEH